jgi:putative membrane protein
MMPSLALLELRDLPALNATLNGLATIFLLAGYGFIRRRQIPAHRVCMIAAVIVSALFLASYLTYHFNHLTVRFTTPGWPKVLYFVILFTHIPSAVINLPMILVTFYFAATGNFERHRRWARVTWPLWMYVSVTGVLVYLMLYQIWPSTEIPR